MGTDQPTKLAALTPAERLHTVHLLAPPVNARVFAIGGVEEVKALTDALGGAFKGYSAWQTDTYRHQLELSPSVCASLRLPQDRFGFCQRSRARRLA